MKLYWGSGSRPCMKVIMTLAEKGKWDSCENVMIEFSKKEHKGADIMKTNPRGQVPTFIDDDISLNESVPICIYLDETYEPKNKLIPSDTKERAKVFQRMMEIPNVSSNVTVPLLYYMMSTPEAEWKDMDKKTAAADTELKLWDSYLGTGDHLVGGTFTMADLFLYCELAMYVRQGLNLAKFYPNLHRLFESLKSRPSAIASYPPHWKTADSKNVLANFSPVSAK